MANACDGARIGSVIVTVPESVNYIPDVWTDEVLKQRAVTSVLATLRDPYVRRGHYRRAPSWVRRLLPRRGWVWDESKREFERRVALLPPRTTHVTFPIIGANS